MSYVFLVISSHATEAPSWIAIRMNSEIWTGRNSYSYGRNEGGGGELPML